MKTLDRAAIPLAIAAVITLVCIMGFRADFEESKQSCEKTPTQSVAPAGSDAARNPVDDSCDSFITRALLAGENG